MEWLVVAGVAIVLVAAGAAARLRYARRAKAEKETGSIYPLW